MGVFNSLFSKKKATENPLKWDMHNHILFGIDDGSKNLEYSLEMARQFVDLGYKKVIATPHIMGDYYPNNKTIINEKAELLIKALKDHAIPLDIQYAAEYYMDEVLLEKVNMQEELLTFYGQHILIETSFMNRPMFFSQLVFELKTKGYIPVLAHPERYVYLHDNYAELEKLIQQGMKLQINMLSLIGYYSPQVKKFAQWMVKNGYYHFLGTDGHTVEQLKLLSEVYKSKIFDTIDFSKVENCR